MSRPCVAERERERFLVDTDSIVVSSAARFLLLFLHLVGEKSVHARHPVLDDAMTFLNLCVSPTLFHRSTRALPYSNNKTLVCWIKKNISSVGHHPRALSSLRHLRADVDLLFHSRSALLYDTANVEPSQQIKEFISTDVPLLYFILCVCVCVCCLFEIMATRRRKKSERIMTLSPELNVTPTRSYLSRFLSIYGRQFAHPADTILRCFPSLSF